MNYTSFAHPETSDSIMAQPIPALLVDIIREGKEDVSWLNRYCQDPKTKDILYYCEASKNSHLTFHKGDKSAEVFAKGDTQQATPGTTTITYILPQVSGFDSPATTFDLDHFHHKLPSLHGKTTFTYNGKEYTWKGHSELVDSENNILAMFFPSWFDGLGQKIGRLEILERGKGMFDVIVVSAMVVQERTDEHKQAAKNARERAAKAGIPFFWP